MTQSAPTATSAAAGAGKKSFFARLRLSPSAYAGALMLAIFIFAGLFGPLLAPYSPDALDLQNGFRSPSADHWLGTDQHGRDVLSQVLHGARIALEISGSVVFLCAFFGVFVGVVSGYFGGKVDLIIMGFVDIVMAFPAILLNIAIVATVAEPGVPTLIIALAVPGWVGYARVARGQVLTLRERDYVMAARCIGANPLLIMRRYIVPNLMSPIMVQMTFGFGTVILVEASLSFLGLGPQVDYTWGAMLDQATTFLWKPGFEFFAIIPGAAIMIVVLGANLLGDGLRDRFDPRHKERSG